MTHSDVPGSRDGHPDASACLVRGRPAAPFAKEYQRVRAGAYSTRCAARRPAPAAGARRDALSCDALSCLTHRPPPATIPTCQSECAILIGLPGAGKTTFYHARLSGTHGSSARTCFRARRTASSGCCREIAAALETAAPLPWTIRTRLARDRAPVIELARRAGARVVAYHVRATTREAVARNEERTGRGPGAEGRHLHRREAARAAGPR